MLGFGVMGDFSLGQITAHVNWTDRDEDTEAWTPKTAQAETWTEVTRQSETWTES